MLEIGLILLIAGWGVQAFMIWMERRNLDIFFVLLYAVGVVLIAWANFAAGAIMGGWLNLAILIPIAFIVLKVTKSLEPPGPRG
jgi:hypothetical protein